MVMVSITIDGATEVAEIDSRKPNRPTPRLMSSAPRVEAVNPAAASPATGRGHASRTAARANAVIAPSRNSGPLTPMCR